MVSNGNTQVLERVYLGLKWGFPGLVRDIRVPEEISGVNEVIFGVIEGISGVSKGIFGVN